ncbi:MAG: polyprenyl synthetase family protein [Anaerolineales bacterium]
MTDLMKTLYAATENELQRQVARLNAPRTRIFHEMLTYHMGWTGEGAGPQAAGKRIRPLLLLLCAAGSGGDWQKALPAAAAVELLHNFSLVHDDIEDHSDKRRGRATLWARWGVPHAINAGDALFVLSDLALDDLAQNFPAQSALTAANLLHQTNLRLTAGQFQDMSYETRSDLNEDDYWPMISGKTAALIAACCEIGAVLAEADAPTRAAYRDFGEALGLAFQVQDDILGIWGDEALTGKSAASDLLEGKKSLPVLYGLGQRGEFAARWQSGPISPAEVSQVAQLLEATGASGYAQNKAAEWTEKALASLQAANPRGAAGAALRQLSAKLLGRSA